MANDGAGGPPDIAGMREFLDRRDRDRPDVFAGREDIIDEVTRAARLAAKRPRGVPGATRVVHGAPGAGKSALLQELAERLAPPGARPGPDAPLVVELSPQDFAAGGVSAVVEVEAAMGARVGRRDRDGGVPAAASSATRRQALRGGALGLRAEAVESMTRNYVGPDVSFRALRRAYPDWRAPIVLLVDEAQGIVADSEEVPVRPGAPPKLMNRALAALHQGPHRLPVVPVYFGLGRTADNLAALGISRPARETDHELGCLSPAEARAVARGTLRRYRPRAAAAELERWARACARLSDGWPQHLNNNLSACFEVAVAAGGALRPDDLPAAMRRAADLRRQYYDQRLRSIGPHEPAVRAVFGTFDGDGPWAERDIVAALYEVLEEDPRMPPGAAHEATAEAFQRTVDAGVLSRAGLPPGQYETPIPSFGAYLTTGEVPHEPGRRASARGPAP